MSYKDQILIDPYDYRTYFFEAVAGRELATRDLRHKFWARFGYVRELPPILVAGKPVASESDSSDGSIYELREWGDGLIQIDITPRSAVGAHIDIIGFFPTMDAAEDCLRAVSTVLPPEHETSIDAVSFIFWRVKGMGGSLEPAYERKSIKVPLWSEVAPNYPSTVRTQIDRLTAQTPPGIAGRRLMLWRGIPGAGKTWAIRALAREWADWCRFHYIIDPAAFFNDPGYMLKVLSKVDEVRNDDDEARWNILVLEDAGEFIALDAKRTCGQALGQLLNLGDGLLGQGLRLLILITTNEDLADLHPAVTRNGRCLANIEFGEFSEDEAREWLEAHNHPSGALPQSRSLADLFACLDNSGSIATKTHSRVVGFTAK